jgi:hypothetical protein
MIDFAKIKSFLEELKQEDIRFKDHFYESIIERPVSEGLVREYITKTARLFKIEEQPSRKDGESKCKLWIKLSNKYSLVVVAVIAGKTLYIITAWNTDRVWQKEIQK